MPKPLGAIITFVPHVQTPGLQLGLRPGDGNNTLRIKQYMGVSKNRDTPKWMVKIMENPIKMDDSGVPIIFGNTHI